MSEQNNEQRSQAAGTDTVDRGNSNEEPDRDCHEWNFEPGDSDQEPYPEYHGANTEECPGGGT